VKVYYCDFCENILNDKRIILTITKEINFNTSGAYDSEEKYDYTKESYEICSTCLQLLRDMLKYKHAKTEDWKKIIDDLYNTKPKSKNKGKRNGKKTS
jgi:hypothetical protein